MMNKLSLGIAGWVFGLALILPARGSAVDVFYAAAGMCTPATPDPLHYVVGSGAVIATGGAARQLNCSFPSGSYIRHTNVNSANVAVYDSSNTLSVNARLCVRDWTVPQSSFSAVVCDTIASTSGPAVGSFALSPGRAAWNLPALTNGYPFVFVSLPTTWSEVIGVYAAAP